MFGLNLIQWFDQVGIFTISLILILAQKYNRNILIHSLLWKSRYLGSAGLHFPLFVDPMYGDHLPVTDYVKSYNHVWMHSTVVLSYLQYFVFLFVTFILGVVATALAFTNKEVVSLWTDGLSSLNHNQSYFYQINNVSLNCITLNFGICIFMYHIYRWWY